MASSTEPNAPSGWDSENSREIRAEALEVLAEMLEWRLTDARWLAVEQIISTMSAAAEKGDVDAFAAAASDLELAAPFRINPIGAAAGPSRQTLQLRSQLVHSIDGISEGKPPAEPTDEVDGDA
jgi:hypothetical protein